MADERVTVSLGGNASQATAAFRRMISSMNCLIIRQMISQRGWTEEIEIEGRERFMALHGSDPDWACTAPGWPVTRWTPELG